MICTFKKEVPKMLISKKAEIGKDVHIGEHCIIEDDVVIGDNVFIDSNTIIRKNVCLGENSFIGANCIIGEYLMDFCVDREQPEYSLIIGKDALIRSGSIIYTNSDIGIHFQAGHHVTIRENSKIGDYVSIGTLSDIQGDCKIGNYVRLHSNVHVGQLSVIENFVWIYPYVILTNDPTPPSTHFSGAHISSFAVVASGAVIMPGLEIGQDSLVAAGAIVTKDVEKYTVVAGNPAKKISDIRDVKNHFSEEAAYPWRNSFKKYMPWMDSDFKTWYRSLSPEQKTDFALDKIDLDLIDQDGGKLCK